jgi:hypothetical protein
VSSFKYFLYVALFPQAGYNVPRAYLVLCSLVCFHQCSSFWIDRPLSGPTRDQYCTPWSISNRREHPGQRTTSSPFNKFLVILAELPSQLFLGSSNKVYIVDKVENNPARINGHPAWASGTILFTSVSSMSLKSFPRIFGFVKHSKGHGCHNELVLRRESPFPSKPHRLTFVPQGGGVMGNGTWLNVGGNQAVTYGGLQAASQNGGGPYDDPDGRQTYVNVQFCCFILFKLVFPVVCGELTCQVLKQPVKIYWTLVSSTRATTTRTVIGSSHRTSLRRGGTLQCECCICHISFMFIKLINSEGLEDGSLMIVG